MQPVQRIPVAYIVIPDPLNCRYIRCSHMSVETLRNKVFAKIDDDIASGKIPVGTRDEYYQHKAGIIKRKMPRINEFGILSTLAEELGLSMIETPERPVESELKIGELAARVDQHDNEVIT